MSRVLNKIILVTF